MSAYTTKRCLERGDRADNNSDLTRIIREHEEVAAGSSDPETARIARGFAVIARRRQEEERWRADAYGRLGRGEALEADASPLGDRVLELEAALRETLLANVPPATRDRIFKILVRGSR